MIAARLAAVAASLLWPCRLGMKADLLADKLFDEGLIAIDGRLVSRRAAKLLVPLNFLVEFYAFFAHSNYPVGADPVLRRFDKAVTNCAGANGFEMRMLFGTPCDVHSEAE